jgi:hypothetical protein
MKSLNINTIATLTTAALVAGDALFDSCSALQAEFKGCDKVAVHSTLLPIVVAHYVAKGADLASKIRGKSLVMTGDKTAVNTATRKLNRLVAAITATVQDKAEIDVPADILAAAAKLWALCQQYEKAGSICASALATAKAK